jgi:lipoprotein-anchoring transpeptidase ErfK/SrfK
MEQTAQLTRYVPATNKHPSVFERGLQMFEVDLSKQRALAAAAIVVLCGTGARAFDGGTAFGAWPNPAQTAGAVQQAAYSTDLGRAVSPSRALVADPTGEAVGTITVDTKNRYLYLSLEGGKAMRYDVGVGREGFAWSGRATIGRRAEWPAWTPPAAMLKRRPDLPRKMEGGIDNPLGARAMYLYSHGRDTMFRIHGTNEPDTIGQAMSSGCIRLLNADVVDLYSRVEIGALVIVL